MTVLLQKPVQREADKYCIECETRDGSTRILRCVPAAEAEIVGDGILSLTLHDLRPDTSYKVRVASVYESEEMGPFSDSVEVSTLPKGIPIPFLYG